MNRRKKVERTRTRVRLDFPGQPLTLGATKTVSTDVFINRTMGGTTDVNDGLTEITVVLDETLYGRNGETVLLTDLDSGESWHVFSTDGRKLVRTEV